MTEIRSTIIQIAGRNSNAFDQIHYDQITQNVSNYFSTTCIYLIFLCNFVTDYIGLKS